MKKPEIKSLRYPQWFRVVFFILTIVGPLTLAMLWGFQSKSGPFRWTFGTITVILLVWLFVKRFFVIRFEKKLLERQVHLEHDYSIDVGNKQKIKWLWYGNELLMTVFDFLTVILYGALIAVILTGVSTVSMSIRGTVLEIAAFYIVAYMMKFVMIYKLRGDDDESN
jgi:hypothetical protein